MTSMHGHAAHKMHRRLKGGRTMKRTKKNVCLMPRRATLLELLENVIAAQFEEETAGKPV